jgi:hypothetical protein
MQTLILISSTFLLLVTSMTFYACIVPMYIFLLQAPAFPDRSGDFHQPNGDGLILNQFQSSTHPWFPTRQILRHRACPVRIVIKGALLAKQLSQHTLNELRPALLPHHGPSEECLEVGICARLQEARPIAT